MTTASPDRPYDDPRYDDLAAATVAARGVVAERFPDARTAWLGGSVARGEATAASDLDVTVLLDGPPAPFRDTVRWHGWLVELFVHTDASLDHYRRADLQDRRQPTMSRLVGESVVLVDRDGSGARRRAECLAEIGAGPSPLSDDDLRLARYRVTAWVDDLRSAAPALRTAAATTAYGELLGLLLDVHRRWRGQGKGLAREVLALDAAQGTRWLERADAGLAAALAGDPGPLAGLADEVLDLAGGPLREGLRLAGEEG
ncbi:nucleotidyltransferase domain-containing protein [Lapillicoccus jejuensis]|uniref:Nucleotidyltransferase-like protein n=1 Tax=Lapillicoccus jejuensis TaxID=402171 RepID=A0A542E6B4_9MICO|nr:nucleotidyltransferase domain-containing protein [Lapillicoccus jejuensis]TQJ10871.1 nucleotidyltransferase-like protein [Lapillicoccus jejuensis]